MAELVVKLSQKLEPQSAKTSEGEGRQQGIGMVPRECSTGGKQKLLGISKRGNRYLRRLFVQGARSVLRQRHKQPPKVSNWLAQLLARTHQNVVIVALANKLLRTAWAVLCKNQTYCIPAAATTS
jgi:transposase